MADVIRILAFKGGKPPKEPKKSPGPIRLTAAARRTQAASALFGAAREERVKLYGTRRSDRRRGLIESFEFDTPLQLDTEDNAICPDLGAPSLAMSDFNEFRANPSAHSWRDVTVERKSLLNWITEISGNIGTAAVETGAIGIVAAAGASESASADKDAQAAARPPRSRPGRERARRAIEKLYPDGVPDQAIEPNVHLCRSVGAKLKEAGFPEVSDDTILRAAGRRK